MEEVIKFFETHHKVNVIVRTITFICIGATEMGDHIIRFNGANMGPSNHVLHLSTNKYMQWWWML